MKYLPILLSIFLVFSLSDFMGQDLLAESNKNDVFEKEKLASIDNSDSFEEVKENKLHIHASGLKEGLGLLQLEIMDFNGRTIYAENFHGNAAEIVLEIDMEERLLPGEYIVRFTKGKTIVSNVLIVE